MEEEGKAYSTCLVQHEDVNLRHIPAPHNPDGRRPVCIQSRFILCSSLRAVIETS